MDTCCESENWEYWLSKNIGGKLREYEIDGFSCIVYQFVCYESFEEYELYFGEGNFIYSIKARSKEFLEVATSTIKGKYKFLILE